MLNEEPALVKQMIKYLYTLNYQVDTRDSESEDPSSAEAAIIKASEGDDSFEDEEVPHQQPEGEGDQEEARKPDEKSESSVAAFDPLSFHILMYSLADRMFIEGLKALSKDKLKRELI